MGLYLCTDFDINSNMMMCSNTDSIIGYSCVTCDNRYKRKINIKNYIASVIPFEVWSHTGFISREYKARLHPLHKFCKKDIKLKKFSENISAISVLSSYMLFNHRNQEHWVNPGTILAPFSNQCNNTK